MAMLPAEQKLATHLQILMHDWPEQAKRDLIDLVKDALAEQREACASICDRYAEAWLDDAVKDIAMSIRARK